MNAIFTRTRKSHRRGRPPKPKKKARIFKFDKEVDKYLASEGGKPGKTMLGVMTELLRYRMSFKTWPPTAS